MKSWKMLDEHCPVTGQVPLMEHPTNGRKFSVATGKFLDEMLAAQRLVDGDQRIACGCMRREQTAHFGG